MISSAQPGKPSCPNPKPETQESVQVQPEVGGSWGKSILLGYKPLTIYHKITLNPKLRYFKCGALFCEGAKSLEFVPRPDSTRFRCWGV